MNALGVASFYLMIFYIYILLYSYLYYIIMETIFIGELKKCLENRGRPLIKYKLNTNECYAYFVLMISLQFFRFVLPQIN